MLIKYGAEEIVCRVKRSEALASRVRIHVYPNGDVEVEAPRDRSEGDIRLAAQKRARWILKQRAAALALRDQVVPRDYVSGETHFYLGRRHKLVVVETNDHPSSVRLLRGRLEVTLPVADPAAVKRRLDEWYGRRAAVYLGSKLQEISVRLSWVKATPNLKLMRMKSQWGSCSPEGAINLNPALIKAPRHCIEYVILHELCHLQEHNHSKRFYDLLTRSMRDWKLAKSELDGLAELLLAPSSRSRLAAQSQTGI